MKAGALIMGRAKLGVRGDPHSATIAGVVREVSHVCATCYQETRAQLRHAECSSACPRASKEG